MDTAFVALLRPFLRYAGDAEITPESRLHELGLDSMQAVELLFAVEDTFGVELADDMLADATFETAGSLWRAIDDCRPAVPTRETAR